MWKCPSCDIENDSESVRCFSCGADYDPPEYKESQPRELSVIDQAKAAKAAGAGIFQAALPLSITTGFTVAMVGAFTTTKDAEHASILDSIEAQGWRLDHVGYVYRVTGTTSRDKFFASGQQEAVSGEIVGIYLFRAI